MDKAEWRALFGESTDLEFQALKDEFGVPKIGDTYTDEEIVDVIGIPIYETRHKTVIERWKRYLMRAENLLLLRERKIGYEIADAEGRMDHSIDRKAKGDKQIRKAGRILGSTNRIDIPEEKRVVYDHTLAWTKRYKQAEREEKKMLTMLLAQAGGLE